MTVRTAASPALASLIVASLMSSTASAQPGIPPDRMALTPDEQALLARGEVSGDRHVIGVVVSVIPGLGLGHLVQQRWKERGWVFTLGEFVAFGFIAAAASESDLDPNVVGTFAAIGWGGFLGLRVWEVTDAVRGPNQHNRRVRELRARTRTAGTRLELFLVPTGLSTNPGTIAGVSLRF